MTVVSTVDFDILERLRIAFGDRQLMDLVDEYVSGAAGWLAALNQALPSNDVEQVRFCIHGLRSPSLSIGARNVIELTNFDMTSHDADGYLRAAAHVLTTGTEALEAFRSDVHRFIFQSHAR